MPADDSPRVIFARRRKVSFRLMMTIISIAGFVTQTSYVSIQFFSYETTSSIRFNATENNFFEFISACFRIADILDYERLHLETGLNLSTVDPTINQVFRLFSSLTVRQLYEYTPSTTEGIIDSCIHRPSRWQLAQSTGSECESLFNMTRYFTMEFMCYQFKQQDMKGITDRMVDHSALHHGRYNQVVLNNKFDRINAIMMIVSDSFLPYRSRDYSYVLPRFKHNNNKKSTDESDHNFVFVTASYLIIDLLPIPYDTKCVYRHDESWMVCFKYCLLDSYIESIDAIPASEIWVERFDKKAFIGTNETNQPMFDQLNQLHASCLKRCSFTSCHLRLGKTYTSAVKENIRTSFGFAAMTASEPDINVKANAFMSFIDYLTFIGSCIGTWFGLSFLSLDVPALLQRVRRRRQVNPLVDRKLFEPSPNGMGIHIYVRK